MGKLLKEVSEVRKHYEEIARLTGENFNIFKILNLSTSEVRTHSAFLAELLNPDGSHNQGAVYLHLFIEKLHSCIADKNKLNGFQSDKAKVYVENNIGFINKDKTEGGNLDILIRDVTGREIVIENKIYACDQEKQLIRYSNYLKGKNGVLLYLNLNKHDPSPNSTDDKNLNISLVNDKDYFIISYEDFILEWLEECHKASASLAIIRESIKQYIHLIRSLTGKSLNKTMENQIAEKMSQNGDYVNSSFDIHSNLDQMKTILMGKLVNEFSNYAANNNLKFLPDEDPEDDNTITTYYSFYLNDHMYVCYGFNNFPNNFFIGVRNDLNRDKFTEQELKIKNELIKVLNKADDNHECWIYSHSFKDSLNNWNKREIWISIADGKLFENELKGPLDKIITVIKQIL